MKFIKYILIIAFISFLLLEMALRVWFVFNKSDKLFVMEPHTFFETDSIVGWKLKFGDYKVLINHESNVFYASIDSTGSRKVFSNSGGANIDKSIFIYGCSCTFGISVQDSSTQAQFLQNQLQNYKVVNKGVPGYGLTQMFLHLQKNVEEGDTPTIAVFNYSGFHDVRTPEHQLWLKMIYDGLIKDINYSFANFHYPYFPLQNKDSLRYMKLEEIISRADNNHYSLLVKQVNTSIRNLSDQKKLDELHEISLNTAFKIVAYCTQRNITPIFAQMNNEKIVPVPSNIIDSLQANNYFAFSYSFDFSDPTYNCSPYDNSHPNELAHSLYANELVDYMKKIKILN